MIQAKGIIKSFGENHVLKGVDVDFYPGKTNLIIGRSGSGKTVFLKTILGLFEPDDGSIHYAMRCWVKCRNNVVKHCARRLAWSFKAAPCSTVCRLQKIYDSL